jgi:polysaccharide deacetylase 2 family uncharacterized protein YibQ
VSPKKKRKKSAPKKNSKLIFILLSVVVLLLPIVSYLGIEAYNKSQSTKSKTVEKSTDDVVQKMKDLLQKQKHLSKEIAIIEANKTAPDKQEDQNGYYLSEAKDYAMSLAQIEYDEKEDETPKQPHIDKTNPKMLIIIDDISFASQVRAIQETNLKLTMSYLPPTSRHPQSALIAQNDPHAMLHLPLEALSHNSPENKTLTTTQSKAQIKKQIKEYRKLYPNVKYTNNHTGSKFTADLKSMKTLLAQLQKQGFIFIDSKTTRDSKAQEASVGIQPFMLQRDVFLDNNPDVEYIQNQLRLAVKKAKKNGLSIAIGHPHQSTIDALRDSKDILEGVTLVYPNEL